MTVPSLCADREGKHYGQLTPVFDVLEALALGFTTPEAALLPSLEKIAERAGCARSTVTEALPP